MKKAAALILLLAICHYSAFADIKKNNPPALFTAIQTSGSGLCGNQKFKNDRKN